MTERVHESEEHRGPDADLIRSVGLAVAIYAAILVGCWGVTASASGDRPHLLGAFAVDVLIGPLREFPLVAVLSSSLMTVGIAWRRKPALLVVGGIGALLWGATGCAMAGLRVT